MIKRAVTPIGLDIGNRQIKAVQLRRVGGKWRVTASMRVPRISDKPMDSDEAARIADILGRQGFAGRHVIVALPPEHLMTAVLELPGGGSGALPIAEIAKVELCRVHGREPTAIEMAHWPVPPPARASKSAHIMGVACGHDAAERVVDSLLSADVFADAIDSQTCALARACSGEIAAIPPGEMLTLLDLGFNAARLAILHSGVIIYCRVIEQGGLGYLAREVRQQLDLDIADWEVAGAQGLLLGNDDEHVSEVRDVVHAYLDQVVKEMNISFSYAAHQYPDAPMSRVVVAGGGAEIPGMVEQLAGFLDSNVQVASMAQVVTANQQKVPAVPPSMTLAVGLALYEEV